MYAFGTNTATETDTLTPLLGPLPTTLRPISSTRSAVSLIATMSSSVSVGRPIMKYSFIRRQPLRNAFSAAVSMSFSVTFLLMTSRRRWLPASGANVRPPRLDPPTSAAISTPNESRRCDGMDTRTPVPRTSSLSVCRICAHCEWSVVESDVSDTSSCPVSARPSRAAATTCSAGRSRTGRYVMPAWQKRQPRAQPRSTSTARRSCTTSMYGTILCGTGSVDEKSCRLRLYTTAGAPVFGFGTA